MASLRALAAGRDIRLVEDAAHAFGSSSRDGWAGALGDAGCFSFDPIKNITCGGGALATNDDGVAARAGAACNVGVAQDS